MAFNLWPSMNEEQKQEPTLEDDCDGCEDQVECLKEQLAAAEATIAARDEGAEDEVDELRAQVDDAADRIEYLMKTRVSSFVHDVAIMENAVLKAQLATARAKADRLAHIMSKLGVALAGIMTAVEEYGDESQEYADALGFAIGVVTDSPQAQEG